MFEKFNDNIAATVLGIYLLGILVYVVQLLFLTEVWLKGEEVDLSATLIARVLGGAWLGFGIALLLVIVNGPDGQKLFFTALIVAQIATLILVANSALQGKLTSGDDTIIVTVLTLLLLFGCFRIKSRL